MSSDCFRPFRAATQSSASAQTPACAQILRRRRSSTRLLTPAEPRKHSRSATDVVSLLTVSRRDARSPAGTVVGSGQPSVVLSYVSTKTNQNWTYVDCYSDLVPGRALPNGLSNAAQTVEGCLEACGARGYAYCGVEYHGGEFTIALAGAASMQLR